MAAESAGGLIEGLIPSGPTKGALGVDLEVAIPEEGEKVDHTFSVPGAPTLGFFFSGSFGVSSLGGAVMSSSILGAMR